MRRSLALAATLLATCSVGSALAKPNPPSNQPPKPPNQSRPVTPPPRPRTNPPPAQRKTPPSNANHRDRNDHRPVNPAARDAARARAIRAAYNYAYANAYRDTYSYPYGYAYPYGYGSFYGIGLGYSYRGVAAYYYNPPYPLPIYLPAGPMQGVGMQGVQPGLGMNRPVPERADDADPPPPAPADDEPPPKREIRAANPHNNAQAWKYIGYGDTLFAKQRYAEAGDRYRRAISAAPQLAEAWFRRALALTATARYDQAVSAVKRGLALDAKWPKAPFDAIDTLWTDAKAKDAYFATLAKLAAENPASPEILFLVGLHFHIDLEPDQAEKYLKRALRVSGNDADHIEAFLNAE
jgi:tetratricopeptide (TPR) repeat protein